MKMIKKMISQWKVNKTKMMINYQQLALMKTMILQISKRRKIIINLIFMNIMSGKLKDLICRPQFKEVKFRNGKFK